MKRIISEQKEKYAIRKFKSTKIFTVDELAKILDSSIKTAWRRFKKWKTYTSYNKNGRYYTLPDIPNFDENGLWCYNDIRFSKNGNLKNTIIHLVNSSKAGFEISELTSILGIDIRPFLGNLRNNIDLKREKIQGRFVYFTIKEKWYLKQKEYRTSMLDNKKLPTDAGSIAILVETIKNPNDNIEDICLLVYKNHKIVVSPTEINNLFAYHGLIIKKKQTFPS